MLRDAPTRFARKVDKYQNLRKAANVIASDSSDDSHSNSDFEENAEDNHNNLRFDANLERLLNTFDQYSFHSPRTHFETRRVFLKRNIRRSLAVQTLRLLRLETMEEVRRSIIRELPEGVIPVRHDLGNGLFEWEMDMSLRTTFVINGIHIYQNIHIISGT